MIISNENISNFLGIVIQCLSADVNKLDEVLTGETLLAAVKGSRQWLWERDRDRETPADVVARTDCLIAMIPDSNEDMSFVIRAGYQEGRSIAAILGFQRSNVLDV